jgi:hypothetical protein
LHALFIEMHQGLGLLDLLTLLGLLVLLGLLLALLALLLALLDFDRGLRLTGSFPYMLGYSGWTCFFRLFFFSGFISLTDCFWGLSIVTVWPYHGFYKSSMDAYSTATSIIFYFPSSSDLFSRPGSVARWEGITYM